ncbi:MAG: hypothetical protein ABIG37_01140 [Nanoarchaeota archaeon]|nr:hypothetical protein [Nanoarchaeota archaeon]
MFSKKCNKCNGKISKDFDFCPCCGNNLRKQHEEEDYGLLGKDDVLPDFGLKMPFGLNKIFNTLLSQLDNQFGELDNRVKQERKIKKEKKNPFSNQGGLSIKISSSTGERPEIQIRGFGPGFKEIKTEAQKPVKIKQPKISEEKLREFSKLPKKEAETNVRRLSNKIIYELNVIGVKSISDVIINKLENSIEIKAFSNKIAYSKIIPINLPLLKSYLEKQKLILEFKIK